MRLEAVRQWASAVKRDLTALALAVRDSRTPWPAKAIAIAVVAYACSPIDLIPDFIPVLGYLDDLILVPLGILLVVQLIPTPLMAEFRAQAATAARPVSRAGAVVIALLWLASAAWLVRLLRGGWASA